NFRVFHNQSRDLAEQTARVAEKSRADMARKWLGELEPDWNHQCDIVLHATTEDYSRTTGKHSSLHGHSTIQSDGGRVLSRRIDLHCDDTSMLTAVLRHETTHVVVAGKLGDYAVPRWADEGMAVLSEPRDKIDSHLRGLPSYRTGRQLFGVRQL